MNETFEKAATASRRGLFFIFFILCAHLIMTTLGDTHSWTSAFWCAVAAGAGALSWWRTRWALYGFILCIPLISGVELLAGGVQAMMFLTGVPILSVLFASIYLPWFCRRTFAGGEGFRPASDVGRLVDVLSGVAVLSLAVYLLAYPPEMAWRAIRSTPALGANDPTWPIRACVHLLQGMFLLRMLELESPRDEIRGMARLVPRVHAATIILFSLAQFLLGIPFIEKAGLRGLVFSPFDDIHSYGSYVALLFFALMFIDRGKGKFGGWNDFIAGILLILIILSSSFATLMALVVTGFVLLALGRRVRWILVAGGLLVAAVAFVNIHPEATKNIDHPAIKRYANRLALDTFPGNVKGRIMSMDQALGMIREHPTTGTGVGTFFRISRHYDVSEKGHPERIENAHNYYLQLAAEMGLPALALFLGMLYCTFRRGFPARRGGSDPLPKGLLAGLFAYSLTMLTGHPLLLSNQQFLFWFIVAAVVIPHGHAAGETPFGSGVVKPGALLGLLAAALAIGYAWRLVDPDPKLAVRESGFYHYEKWGDEEMRWTARESLSIVEPASDLFGMKVAAAYHNSAGPGGLPFKLFVNDRLLRTVHFFNGGETYLYLRVPSVRGEGLRVKTEVGETFNPRRMGLNSDRRDLGVAVSPVTFLEIMPRDGVGFHAWETWSGGIPKWPPDVEPRFRWTGLRATMNLTEYFGGVADEEEPRLILYLLCSHPDIGKNPVTVRISGDEGVALEVLFEAPRWKPVILDLRDFRKFKVATLQASRTWNPRLAGVSGDSRDLGAAVAVLKTAE